LFDGIDLTLPDEQFAEWLEFVLQQRVGVDEDGNQLATPSGQEIELLRTWAARGGPDTRRVAVRFLVDNGPCSWEDLETWSQDPDQDIRYPVVSGPIFDPVRQMLESDKPRWVRLLTEAAWRYPDDYQPAFVLRDLAAENPAALDLTWEAASSLWDVNDPELNTMLFVGYFEHVIPDLGLGPDDKHVEPWITGADQGRQRLLLQIATCWGLDAGRMREIVQALAGSKVKNTAELARGVLNGSVGYDDL
jgi:hypothetical protein